MTDTPATPLSTWESVQQIHWPFPGLSAEVITKIEASEGSVNCFSDWPAAAKRHAIASLDRGVEVGHVAKDYDKSTITGTAKFAGDFMELRASWKPPGS